MTTPSKTPGEYLALYAKGWTEGDVDTILSATTPGYTFDDPRDGPPVTRDQFRDYFATVRKLRSVQPFMELSDVVVQSAGDGLLAWCWWAIPGAVEGSGFIRVGPTGVLSEKIAYYQ